MVSMQKNDPPNVPRKKLVFQSKISISTYSLILFSKNSNILSVKELFKVIQIGIRDYQYYSSCNAKKWPV